MSLDLVVSRGSHVYCLSTWYIIWESCQQSSTEKCYLVVSDRTSSLISVLTEVPEVDFCIGNLFELNDLNHVWARMGSDPIQSQKWFLLLLLFVRHNIQSILGSKFIKGITACCTRPPNWRSLAHLNFMIIRDRV